MLILFITFPRLEPLWGVPDTGGNAKTGPSDTMSPGDIAHLAGNTDLAFRATFDGVIPPPQQRYWRGLVFSEFDGRTWTTGNPDEPGLPEILKQYERLKKPSAQPEHRYSILLEPSQQTFLYALAGSARAESNSDVQAALMVFSAVHTA